MKRWISAIATAAVLSGCTPLEPRDYAGEGPPLDLRAYFDGKVDGWGFVQDRSGRVTQRMAVEITASWQGDVGTLDEKFTHADGRRESRVWTLRRDGARYIGTAGDVVGEARGETAGPAFRWRYVLAVKRDNGETVNLDMDDWMWLVDGRTLGNRTEFSKFGIRLGEVTFFFRKRG